MERKLKRAFKYGLCSQLFSFLDLADDADQTFIYLFNYSVIAT